MQQLGSKYNEYVQSWFDRCEARRAIEPLKTRSLLHPVPAAIARTVQEVP